VRARVHAIMPFIEHAARTHTQVIVEREREREREKDVTMPYVTTLLRVYDWWRRITSQTKMNEREREKLFNCYRKTILLVFSFPRQRSAPHGVLCLGVHRSFDHFHVSRHVVLLEADVLQVGQLLHGVGFRFLVVVRRHSLVLLVIEFDLVSMWVLELLRCPGKFVRDLAKVVGVFLVIVFFEFLVFRQILENRHHLPRRVAEVFISKGFAVSIAEGHRVQAKLVGSERVTRPERHDDGHPNDVFGIVGDRGHVMQHLGAMVQNAHSWPLVVDRVSQIAQVLLPFQFVESLKLRALHDFEGATSDLGHITQHEDTDIGQAIMVPMINGSFVTKFTDVDLGAVGVAEVGPDWFASQFLQQGQMLGAGHHVSDKW